MLLERMILFTFKGDRTYVHGTDIFDKTLQSVRSFFDDYPTRIKGSFHHLLRNNCMLRIYKFEEQLDYKTVDVYFTIWIRDCFYKVAILKTNSEICSSRSYDEYKITCGLRIDNSIATMAYKSSFSYIEQIVAMTKQLHLTIYPDAGHRWLLSKIDMRDFLDPSLYPGHKLMIRPIKQFHYKLTQNAIFFDTHFLGHIWFSKFT